MPARSGAVDRLLEEVEPAAFHRAHIVDGFVGGEALVGVGRNQQAAAEHLADGARARGVILRRIDADLDLESGKAGGLFFAASRTSPSKSPPPTTPISANRLRLLPPSSACTGWPRRLAGEIVQRDLDRRLGAVVAVHAPVHGGERAGDVGGSRPTQHRRKIMDGGDHALHASRRSSRRRRRFAPADEAVVGFDAHQHIVGAAHLLARHDDAA